MQLREKRSVIDQFALYSPLSAAKSPWEQQNQQKMMTLTDCSPLQLLLFVAQRLNGMPVISLTMLVRQWSYGYVAKPVGNMIALFLSQLFYQVIYP